MRSAYPPTAEKGPVVDYTEVLRRLAINDAAFSDEEIDASELDLGALDDKTSALVRLASLVSVGGAVPSYGAQADAAIGAGATAPEIVEVLLAVLPVVGLPRVVAAAPRLALALGHDVEEA